MTTVAHLSTQHRPYDVRIFAKQCATLAEAGFDVHYIVPNAPAEGSNGVTFHAFERPARFGRVKDTWLRLRNAYRAAVALDAQVYHFHDPELIPVGILLRRKGASVVYDAHEDSPMQSISGARQLSIKGKIRCWLMAGVWLGLESIARRVLDGFVCATDKIRSKYPPKRTITVFNFPILAEFDALAASAQGIRRYSERPNVVVYAGGLTPLRGSKEMINAMSLIDPALGARLALVGKFTRESFKTAVEGEPGWERVDYTGWVRWDEAIARLLHARVGIVTLHRTPAYVHSLPVKLFEYMAAGLPVVASDFPLWRSIVQGAGCGLLVDPRDPQAIADATAYLLQHPDEADAMGRRGRQAVEAHYTWERERCKLVEFYGRLVGPGAAGGST